MIHYRRITSKISFVAFLCLSLLLGSDLYAQNGQQLFSQNCASCHSVNKDLTGPALAGVLDRGPWKQDKKNIYAWVHNPPGFMKNNAYTQGLQKKFQVVMTPFPQLSDQDIDAILNYINSVKPPTTQNPQGGTGTTETAETGDNTLLFGILTLILAIVALTLVTVNSNLKKMADQAEGHPVVEPVPFWRNKVYIAIVIIALFLISGYLTVQAAIGLGRMQGYEPKQPIFFSHKVHAGTNQISCLYCHFGAQESKHANIPPVNVCMNCHMAINEYKGPDKLVDGDNNEVDGTAQIQKLYKYVGYEPGKPYDANKAKPIEWVRIHNLPDLVYFNHSQHVVVGKVACQTCHGEVQKMNEVYQFADLSMGWCINCHRTTQVQFKDNGFYSIYQKFQNQIKNGTLDSTKMTVAKMGGTDCQKCHY